MTVRTIPVTGITFPYTSKTLTKGTSCTLTPTIAPSNATNKAITWESNNTSVATVNQNGKVTAIAGGDAIITATAADGSGICATCKIHVVIPVTKIELSATSLNLKVGNTHTLTATVTPDDATNKAIIWSSSNENAVTVDSNGNISAQRAGVSVITATTTDGSYLSAMCTVEVTKTNVTIMKDDYDPGYTMVQFEDGRIWRCVNHDLLYHDKGAMAENVNGVNMPICTNYGFFEHDRAENRANYNYWVDYVMNDPYYNRYAVRTYTDEELKLLYTIDPFGVADYVHRYADIFDTIDEKIQYKDDLFLYFFGREATHLGYIDGTWKELQSHGSWYRVISESEAYFGAYNVQDLTGTLIATVASVASILINTCPFFAKYEMAKSIASTMISTAVLVVSLGEEDFDSALVSWSASGLLDQALETQKLSWASNIISYYSTFGSLSDALIQTPTFYKEVIDYCSLTPYFNVLIKLEHESQSIEIQRLSNLFIDET